MDNQHQKIKGYRDLSQAEIDMMNTIEGKGEELRELCKTVSEWAQVNDAAEGTDSCRWAAIGRTDLQTGIMALVRAVARPESF